MVNKSRWLALVCAVLMAVLTGCATAPPRDLVERDDHAGLAAWYEQEAANLRARAGEMRDMAKAYEVRMTKPGQRSELVRHCQALVERYTKAAEEAEALAKLHRDQIGS